MADPWTIPETTTRATWYGVGGIPHVRCDGKYSVVGAASCGSAYADYREKYDAIMAETGGVSPVEIEGCFSVVGPDIILYASAALLDAFPVGPAQVTFFLWEDGVDFEGTTYDGVVRAIRSQAVTLTDPDQVADVDMPLEAGPWNLEHLGACAVLQQITGTKTVIQSAVLERAQDFTVTLDRKVASAPEGNGTALLHATVRNIGLGGDVLHLAVDQAAGWPTDMRIGASAEWVTAGQVALGPQQSVGITIRVQTDAIERIGAGHLFTTSTLSGRTRQSGWRVFNGSPSVLLVDDDYNGSYELPFTGALSDLGYLFEDWDVHLEHTDLAPTRRDLAGFDLVLWQTGDRMSDILTEADIAEVKSYLDGGGRLYLDSMDFLGSQSGPNAFTTDYLGVAAWTNSTRAHIECGVAGDPISDGLVLPLSFPDEASNRVDRIVPAPDAVAFFYNEYVPPDANAVRRFLPSGGRVVFSTIPQAAISDTDLPPNNSRTVMERTLGWLFPPSASVRAPSIAGRASLTVEPDPFPPGGRLRFRLGASSPARVVVFDAGGRAVRTLVNRSLPAGAHEFAWDGAGEGGKPAPAGVYFVRLTCSGGEASGRLVLTR